MNILMPYQVYEKIMYWVDKADFEVSGFGKIVFDGKNFQVTDAVLLKQKGGSAHTDIEAESLSRVQYLLKDQPGELRFWWHSHVNMQTFMSGTDQYTIKELGSHGWAVASVFNKRREITNAISYKYTTPFGEEKTHYEDKLDLIVTYPATTEAEKESYTKQFDDNVTKSVVPTSTGYLANANYDEEYPDVIDMTRSPSSYMDENAWSRYTIFERECAEALECSCKQFKKKYKAANDANRDEMSGKISMYWVEKRGYEPFDYSGEYDDLYMSQEDFTTRNIDEIIERNLLARDSGFGEHNA